MRESIGSRILWFKIFLSSTSLLRDGYMPLFDSNAAVSIVSIRREFTVATTMMFRAFCLTTAVVVSGCATQHNGPQSPLTAAPAPDVSPVAAAAPSADVEVRRVAADAKKLNLEAVKTDGKVRYCRSNVVTGSRFGKDRQCYTAEQVEVLQGQTQQSGSH
jgi:hypothetical protein